MRKIKLREGSNTASLFGHHDQHLKLIEEELGVRLSARGDEVTLDGAPEAVRKAERLLMQLAALTLEGYELRSEDVALALKGWRGDQDTPLKDFLLNTVPIATKKRFVIPKSATQKTYIEAIQKYDLVIGIGPAGTGKCIAAGSLVFTSEGLCPIESLAAGTKADEYVPINVGVIGLNGVEQVSHFYNGGLSPTKRIRTRFGYEIEVTCEHPLLRITSEGAIAWERADGLTVGDFVAIQRGQNLFGSDQAIDFEYERNTRYDRAKPVHLDQLDEEFAYFMGTLTGDGCLTFRNRVILSSSDKPILECFYQTAAKLGLHVFNNGVGRPYDRIIASSQLYQLLHHLGMIAGPAAEKRVPHCILRAPRQIAAAYLRGLFDADGTVSRRDGYPTLYSVSKQLLDVVQVMLLNFGILARKRPKWTTYRGMKRISYQLEISGADAGLFLSEIGTGLPRKRALFQERMRNPNADVVPFLDRLIHEGMAGGRFPHSVHKRLDDYKTGRRSPSYAKLGEILGMLREGSSATAALGLLEEHHEQHLFWAEIEKIEDGVSQVYDLTVPGSHSFCANGFVNHNTYLAMAMAVAALMGKEVSRIILARPAVEAGEKLGYLPGDMYAKINPYLRPLYDALYDMMDVERANRLVERGEIEIAPLAFMRGRTLNDSFVILDEAQNATTEQMKMFLTRLGFNCKAVVTGDITQVDLPLDRVSGLIEVREILKDISGIQFVYFDERDVVRHKLVQEIIKAYDQRDAGRPVRPQAARPPRSAGRRRLRQRPGGDYGEGRGDGHDGHESH
ncbi:PhoH family protein [Nitrospiraceae bacterium AH_259_D15_M11_P09]|nr:PhoH family protein [Nitrospiraceae bacterium AH_259_D15_M11_P09]